MPPTLTKDCVQCGGRFTAKRHTAKYCSPRCRMRASRAMVPAPARLEAPPVVKLAPPVEGKGIYSVTRRVLEDAERLDTPMGQATMLIAEILSSGIQDTGSSIAALVRQYDASLTKALDGALSVESPLERARREREARAV